MAYMKEQTINLTHKLVTQMTAGQVPDLVLDGIEGKPPTLLQCPKANVVNGSHGNHKTIPRECRLIRDLV